MLEKEGGALQVLSSYEDYGIHLSPHAKDLVVAMIRPQPKDRPSLEQVLQSRFMVNGESKDDGATTY